MKPSGRFFYQCTGISTNESSFTLDHQTSHNHFLKHFFITFSIMVWLKEYNHRKFRRFMIQQKGMITVRLKEYKQRKFRRLMIQQKGMIAERPTGNIQCNSMCIVVWLSQSYQSHTGVIELRSWRRHGAYRWLILRLPIWWMAAKLRPYSAIPYHNSALRLLKFRNFGTTQS